MTGPFVTQLRSRGDTLQMAPEGAPYLVVRVEMPEVWDTVRVAVSPDDSIVALKVRALEALYPTAERHEEFVLKLKGWEVLDESVSVARSGAIDGSCFLLTHRRRRPVR
jgi:hypothetical protein